MTEPIVSPVLEQFRQSAHRYGLAVLAYCFMPNHLHILYEAQREDAELLPCVRDARQRSGYSYKRRTGDVLWQHGFYDRVVRDEDSVPAVVRYIMANPVRAGLVGGIGEYDFCGSDVYSMKEIVTCVETWTPRPAVTRTR